ncbi:RluA family pseudouridine synthase [Pelagibacterales bacterium SAG-MED31]|nr:RluA family pseudouridine synthase [Pelagibacterales bacterium SAG-MED31]
MIKKIKITLDSEDQRLDKFLKFFFSNLSQSFIEKNLRKKNILVNDSTVKSKYLVKVNDLIIIKNFSNKIYSDHKRKKNKNIINHVETKKFNESILYENDNFLIIDKWCGISTQGGTNISISIDNIIKNISINYNLVHRLDKETSGLLIIAKNLKYTKIFGKLFKLQQIKKTYLALCDGKPKMKESYIDLLLYNDNQNEIKTKTYYKIISYNQKTSLIQFEPKTGKKHQLRIVAKNLGCSIIGDNKYNLNNANRSENLKLNAYQLEFKIENNAYIFSSKLPKDFTDLIKKKQIIFA